MSSTPFECKDCKMKFENSQQFAIHTKKFCINSDYGSLTKLDKQQNELQSSLALQKPSQGGKDPSNLKNYGQFTLDQLQSNLKTEDPDFKKLEDIVLRKREDELLQDVERMRREREHEKIMSELDEGAYLELLTESGLRNERELQARIDKDEIRKQFSEIDSWKMSAFEERRKNELERLLKDRESLRIKQIQLIDEIIQFQQGHKKFASLLQSKSSTRAIAQVQYQEQKQRLVNLSTRKDQLENERNRIYDNLERLRLGDLGAVKQRAQSSATVKAAEQILNETGMTKKEHYADIAKMRDKLEQDALKLEMMKRELEQQREIKTPQPQQYPQPPPQPQYTLPQSRQLTAKSFPNDYADKVLKDLWLLKQDYQKAGGNDPQFIQNLNNLEKFYRGEDYQHNAGTQVEQPKRQRNKPSEPDLNDPFNSFSRKKEFFLANNVRGVDLSREEKLLLSLTEQEVDHMRVMSRIPQGTEIYRFKMEQFKELSQQRAEVEKVLQEQRLARLKKNFENKRRQNERVFENNKWVDDNRKQIIEQRLKDDNQEQPDNNNQTYEWEGSTSKYYEPQEGFYIHWDYIVGLPKRAKFCQVVYAIYNNLQQLFPPKLVEPIDCELETATTNRVIINDNNQITGINPHPETLLIIEVQLPVSRKMEENLGKTESFAWTQIDLYDQLKNLKRGKFRCPLYQGPTDPHILVEDIPKLEPIQDSWLHLRITFPNDEDYWQIRSIQPEQTANEYLIPNIHLRNLIPRNYEIGLPKNKELPPDSVRIAGTEYKVQENIEINNRRTPVSSGQLTQISFAPGAMKPLKPGQNRGISIAIHQLQNHVAQNHLRVMLALLHQNQLLIDTQGLPVAFNTTIHDPESKIEGYVKENVMIPLTVANPEFEGISNKANNSTTITFQEEYRIFFDAQDIAFKAQNPIFIGIQIVERTGEQDNSRSTTFGDFTLVGWNFIELINIQGQIKVGRQNLPLYAPPLRRPPFDINIVKEMKQQIELSINALTYTLEEMMQWKQIRRY